MAGKKLLAEWFWTDRWMGSAGFLLPMEARGLYREMLTAAWRRGARLPNNPEAIRRAVASTVEEWERAWPAVQPFWRVTDDGAWLVNDTQLEVYEEARLQVETASDRAKKAVTAREEKRKRAISRSSQDDLKIKRGSSRDHHKTIPPSPSPSPSPSPLPTDTASGPAPRAAPDAPAKTRQTWLTGYGDDWRDRWGAESEPPWGEMAGTLRAAHGEHGEAVLRGCWRRFLAASERSSWARPARFIQGLGEWMGTAAQPPPGAGKPNGRAARIDAKIAARMRKHAGGDQQALEIEGKGEP